MSGNVLPIDAADSVSDNDPGVRSETLASSGLTEVIQRYRSGKAIALVCQVAVSGFSPSLAYPIQRVAQGHAIIVINDVGKEVTLEADSSHLGKFLVAENPAAAQAISAHIQQEAVTRIADAGVAFLQTNQFARGSMVRWKPGMRVARLLAYGQPAVVLQVLREPLVDEDASVLDPSRSYRCDLLIGVESTTGQFATFYADSRRLEHFTYQAVRDGTPLTELLEPNQTVSNPGVH